MAGVKGRSGGARPGAGRKPRKLDVEGDKDSLAFLISVYMDPAAPLAERVKAAIAAAPYQHKKMGEGGKTRAPAQGEGKFAGAPPPLKLVPKTA